MPKKHVQFGASDESNHEDNSIKVSQETAEAVNVYLGYLKCFFKYRIEVFVPHTVAIISENFLESTGSNLHCISKNEHGCNIVLTIETNEDKIVPDKIFLRDGGNSISLVMNGSVLGPEKGTPLLRNGIHIISKLPNCEL